MAKQKNEVDLIVRYHGSIVTILPNTETGREWIADNVQAEDWQWHGDALCVETRFAPPIVDGAVEFGLEVA